MNVSIVRQGATKLKLVFDPDMLEEEPAEKITSTSMRSFILETRHLSPCQQSRESYFHRSKCSQSTRRLPSLDLPESILAARILSIIIFNYGILA